MASPLLVVLCILVIAFLSPSSLEPFKSRKVAKDPYLTGTEEYSGVGGYNGNYGDGKIMAHLDHIQTHQGTQENFYDMNNIEKNPNIQKIDADFKRQMMLEKKFVADTVKGIDTKGISSSNNTQRLTSSEQLSIARLRGLEPREEQNSFEKPTNKKVKESFGTNRSALEWDSNTAIVTSNGLDLTQWFPQDGDLSFKIHQDSNINAMWGVDKIKNGELNSAIDRTTPSHIKKE
jgi:hypothetical protein